MYWKLFCKELIFTNQIGKFVKIYGKAIPSDRNYWVYINYIDYQNFNNGMSFEEAFKSYTKEDKQFLLFGTAPTFLCKETNSEKVIFKAYITNAVANSVTFYAMSFLNNFLTPNQIIKMRKKYSLGDFQKEKFSIDELRDSFLNQSAFFLNLYSFMNENDRFENFANNLENQNQFKRVFSNYENSNNLIQQYNRRIFHNKFECVFMRNDYNVNGEYHQNTRVFAETNIVTNDNHFYQVEMSYLEKLKMRICNSCENTI